MHTTYVVVEAATAQVAIEPNHCLIDLCPRLEIRRVPVIRQTVFVEQVPHDGRTAEERDVKILHKNYSTLYLHRENGACIRNKTEIACDSGPTMD